VLGLGGVVVALTSMVPVLTSGSIASAAALSGALSVPARPSAGCAQATRLASGATNILLNAGGEDGAYVREVPPSYRPGHPMPLIVDLHGYEEPATLQVDISALGQYGAVHGFITVTPQVAGAIPHWVSTIGGKDLAFFAGLLANVEDTLCVDLNRVFVTGYSNGAFLTSAIACQFSAQVAAVAPVSGLEEVPGCRQHRPVPIVTFHGTADPFVAYLGGIGPKAVDIPLATLGTVRVYANGPSVPAITASWARRNHCAPLPSSKPVTSDVTLIAYRCPRGASVELYRIAGGGHQWPGSVASKPLESDLGRVTFSISADAIMWRFFQDHPLTRTD
jgi:polyhydroxybutyrate depolymerase